MSEHDWNAIDMVVMTGALAVPTIAGPAVLLAAGETHAGALLALGTWFMVTAYESPLVERWKAEVGARV